MAVIRPQCTYASYIILHAVVFELVHNVSKTNLFTFEHLCSTIISGWMNKIIPPPPVSQGVDPSEINFFMESSVEIYMHMAEIC